MDPINLNPQETASTGGKGSLIGAIIVVIILIIGAIYLFSGRTEAPIVPEGSESTFTTPDENGTADLEAAAGAIDLESIDLDAAALDEAVAQ